MVANEKPQQKSLSHRTERRIGKWFTKSIQTDADKKLLRFLKLIRSPVTVTQMILYRRVEYYCKDEMLDLAVV